MVRILYKSSHSAEKKDDSSTLGIQSPETGNNTPSFNLISRPTGVTSVRILIFYFLELSLTGILTEIS